MKLLFTLMLALVAGGAFLVKADEIAEPVTLEVGSRIDGDKLVDVYYTESDETEARATHSVTIDWAYNNINYIRIIAFADSATYEYSGLPSNSGSITITSENVNQLAVYAYLYGLE